MIERETQTVFEVEKEVARPTKEFYFNGNFEGKDVISVEQFTQRSELEQIFELANEMERKVLEHEPIRILNEYRIALLFYQPSSRTFSSFQAAASKLGADVTAMHGMSAYSSAIKGEDLSDTIMTFDQTTAADIIVLRHPDDDSSEIASRAVDIPIINAGSGRKEHPTQAILDIYTIQKKLGRIDDLTITMTGDLRNGRTVKSLAKLLAMAGENVNINFISPDVLKIPRDIVEELRQANVNVKEGSNGDLNDAITESDILYVTRIQSEWFTQQAIEDLIATHGEHLLEMDQEKLKNFAQELGNVEYRKAQEGYVIDKKRLEGLRVLVMHPFPRVNEISRDVDNTPHNIYKPQMRYGLYSRMALLAKVLGKA